MSSRDEFSESIEHLLRAAGAEFADDFHDLLHRPFGRRCLAQAGGPGRHLRLWWRYQGRDELRRSGPCRVHWHAFVWCEDPRLDPPGGGPVCRACGWPRTRREAG